jgi:acyl-CoA synthetase (NDP forming)
MMEDSNQNIKYLFEPKSIAVIGAARHENKIGYKIFKNNLTGTGGGLS